MNGIYVLSKTNGLTLIEAVVALAIMSVLLALSVPVLLETIQNNRMRAQLNELETSVNLARSEAVSHSNNVTICRSNDAVTCAGQWQNGWLVFIDNDFDGKIDLDDEILSVHGGLTSGNTLTFSQTHLTYSREGVANNGANSTFTLCDERGAEHARGLIIGSTGLASFATDTDSDGIVEGADGVGLTCSPIQ